MSGYDQQGVYYTDQRLSHNDGLASDGRTNLAAAEAQLTRFLHSRGLYAEQLRANYAKGEPFVKIDMADLYAFDESLAHAFANDPDTLIPILEDACKEVLDFTSNKKHVKDIQVHLQEYTRFSSIRDLSSHDVCKLVTLPGIVISASTVRSRPRRVTLQCSGCNDTRQVHVKPGFSGVVMPRTCVNSPSGVGAARCPLDPYSVIADASEFVDQQTFKLQERPEMVPHGDMPRHLLCNMDRHLVSKVKPGSRVRVIGVYSTFTSAVSGKDGQNIKMPYLRVVGCDVENENLINFSVEDEEEMLELARSEDMYELIAKSIAPAIFGHPDIKKAVACQLFGGSRTVLPDGMKLRGDINVLLLGDPSVAKSQFLKFVDQVAPVAVYTSGKGSSAAGLTASVVKDPSSGEFHLEGGALVLGDGGTVCIDEFDKMRDEDRVAIHEAMEQQTISIAKAGITTILNARASVLAAANPIYGKYDELRSAGENISLQTTILSRFDMIFILLDKADAERDTILSKHIMHIHKNMAIDEESRAENTLAPELLRKYITFCRQRCHPRLSDDAAEGLRNHYVTIRKESKQNSKGNDTPIPITVRQLEAIVRISESLARLELADEGTLSF